MNEPASKSLRKTTIGGVVNAASATIVQLVSQIAGLAILARILTPTDFGITAPSLAIASFLALIAEFGLGSNLIQRQEMSATDVGSALLFSMLNAVVLSGIALIFLGDICHLIDLTKPSVLAASLVIVMLVPVATILESVNLKRFRFSRVLVSSIVSAAVGNMAVPVGMAMMGAGLWSIVAAQIVVPLVKVLVFALYMRPRRLPRGSWEAIRAMLHFSSYFTISKILNMVSLQGDRVVLANAVLPASLGLYTRAQNFSQLVITFLTSAFEKALFPLLAAIQNDAERTKRIYMEIFFLISTFTGLAAAVAATISYTLITILLGPSWGEAAGIASVFSIMIFLRCTDRLAAILMRSNSMLRERTVLQAFLAVGTLGSCWIFGRHSLIAVAWAIVACNAIGFFYTQFTVARFMNVPVSDVVRAFAKSALIAGIYSALNWSASLVDFTLLSLELRQLGHAAVAGLGTLLFVFVFRRALLTPATLQVIGSLSRFRRRGRPPSS